MMFTRAVFSEGDAARPITASQPPERACKTSKHYRSRLARPLFFRACARRSRLSGNRGLMLACSSTSTRRAPSSRADEVAVEHLDGAPTDDPRHLSRLEAHLGSGLDRDGRPDQELAAALAPARDVDQAVHGLAQEHFSSTSRTTKPDCCSYRAPHPRTACAAIMTLGAATQRPLVSLALRAARSCET